MKQDFVYNSPAISKDNILKNITNSKEKLIIAGPCTFASYEELFALLTQNGWTLTTAICTIVMCIFHFPCSTTCLTIKKETGSMGWTMFSIVMPTMIGIALCYLISHIM